MLFLGFIFFTTEDSQLAHWDYTISQDETY